MSLRMLEVTVPNEALDQFPEILGNVSVIHVWKYGPADPGALIRILLDSLETEAVSDLLVQQFGHSDDFRMTLTRVEATLPAFAEEEPVETAQKEPERKSRRVSREELYTNIAQASKANGVYMAMVALSTVVASVGLMRNDIAIVIGAMVIAPLLGPNIALSLAAALGDRDLARKSFKAIGLGVAIAGGISLILGALIPFDPQGEAIISRTQPGMGDIMLALSAGAAGALAFTTGVPAVVVGVMVAVALLPPLVVAGLLAASGHGAQSIGALTLCLVNVTCINLSAMTTFYIQKVSPRTWWEAGKARRATLRATLAWAALLVLLAVLMTFAKSHWQ